MMIMNFVWQLDDQRIINAIRDAETQSSVEIRVHVSDCPVTDPVAAAEFVFNEMGMTRTRLRNAVLVFVAPRSNRLAVVGDTAADAACGPTFWQTVVSEMLAIVRESPSDAIVHGIRRIGQCLKVPFPRGPDDVNELPDAIHRDPYSPE